MSDAGPLNASIKVRASAIKSRLRRKRLLLVQMGAMFDSIREDLLLSISGAYLDASELVARNVPFDDLPRPLILVGLESFAADSAQGPDVTLGQLRARVDEILDANIDVCLVSRSPRCSYPTVPGSSLLFDSAVYLLPLLGALPDDPRASEFGAIGGCFPPVFLDSLCDVKDLFVKVLSDFGLTSLAALDHALFETAQGSSHGFLLHLDVREQEALIGAGIAYRGDDGTVCVAVPQKVGEFREAVAEAIAGAVSAPSSVSSISSDIWFIERTLRRSIRTKAIEEYGSKWRRRVLYGDLPEKVLARARADANVSATSIAELRDPVEWLTLGEMLELIERVPFSHLSGDAIFWRKFASDILPVRNRLSHMRVPKLGDSELMRSWVGHVRRVLG